MLLNVGLSGKSSAPGWHITKLACEVEYQLLMAIAAYKP